MTLAAAHIGETLRRLRNERQLSLAGVAEQAGVSIATLSRVETNKQNIDVAMLMRLASILEVAPAEIFGTPAPENDPKSLAQRLSKLSRAERTRVYLESSRRRNPAELAAVVDDLLATFEILRDELLSVRQAVRKRKL